MVWDLLWSLRLLPHPLPFHPPQDRSQPRGPRPVKWSGRLYQPTELLESLHLSHLLVLRFLRQHSKKKGRYTINKYRRYCIATDVIVFQQYNELYSKYNELYSKYNELYSKNKNWIANAIIVLIPPKKCKKNKKCIGKMAEKPSLFAVQLSKQKYNY